MTVPSLFDHHIVPALNHVEQRQGQNEQLLKGKGDPEYLLS